MSGQLQSQMKGFITNLIQKQYKSLYFPSDSDNINQKSSGLVFTLSCSIEPKTRREMERRWWKEAALAVGSVSAANRSLSDLLCENNKEHIVELKLSLIEHRES